MEIKNCKRDLLETAKCDLSTFSKTCFIMYDSKTGLPEHFTIKYKKLILSKENKQNEFLSHTCLEKR